MTNELKFIYFTDYHGDIRKFDRLLGLAGGNDIRLLVTSGDIFPHRNGLQFINGYFRGWLEKCSGAGIEVLGMLGNDDPAVLIGQIDDFEDRGLFRRIDWRFVEYEGWIFWGYNFVPELPFGMKDWVKLDYPGAPRPLQFSNPVISTLDGYIPIDDIESFFADRGSIEDDLRGVKFNQPSRVIAVTHSPPRGLGLDLTGRREQVGSRSILSFLEERQPLLSLHGHIHESPQVSGIWKTRIGRTTACQPGPRPVMVLIRESVVELSAC